MFQRIRIHNSVESLQRQEYLRAHMLNPNQKVESILEMNLKSKFQHQTSINKVAAPNLFTGPPMRTKNSNVRTSGGHLFVGHVGLELTTCFRLALNSLPSLSFPSAGTADLSYYTWQYFNGEFLQKPQQGFLLHVSPGTAS